jgi:L-fuconolactonase
MSQFEIVDSHVHFWNPKALEYFWLTPSQPVFLQQAFLPDQLESERLQTGVKYGVHVQVGHDPRENDWILEITKPYPWIRGVVGWLDLTATDLAVQLEHRKKDPRFKGVRHLTHAIEDANWLGRKDVEAGLEILAAHDLSLDLVLKPDQLELAFEVVAAHPKLGFVLDHMGNPPFRGDYETWQKNFSKLATLPNLVCKISGLLTGFDGAPDLELLRETIHFGFTNFSSTRLMFGGDHPISALAAPYQRTLEMIRDAVGKLEEDDARAFWSGNAIRVYKLKFEEG